MIASDFDIFIEPDIADGGNQPDRITRTSKISSLLSVTWRSSHANHIDRRFIDNINVWRDYFPAELESRLEGRSVGDTLQHRFEPGQALSEFSAAQIHTVKPQQFNRNFSAQIRLEPRLGRFYPKGIFENIDGNYRSNFQPCRIIGLDDDSITTDFNHPLASAPLDVDLRILDARDGGPEHGGRCNDIIELLTEDGPGMQARHDGIATDFWGDDAFNRDDARPDSDFYSTPRLVDHLDKCCSQQLATLYGQLLPPDGHILDLMSSWVSHLPADFSGATITGLGMNRQELERNPMLAETLVHDLNRDLPLPFADNSFDGIICTASIEYLVSPARVFEQLARILKPGAPLVITFSNRWFPPKAVRIWTGTHEFERIGLVLEYFINNGSFDALHSYSLRGLPRPADDRYADRLSLSDPVYAVWGYRR